MFSIRNTITTQNRLAIRDGFVEIPDAMRFRQTVKVSAALAAVPGSSVVKLTYAHSKDLESTVVVMSSSFPILGTGLGIADELWFQLPVTQDGTNQTDWYQVLRDTAAATVVH